MANVATEAQNYAVFPRAALTRSAVCTAAKTTYGDAANAVPLLHVGPYGGELAGLTALPRGVACSDTQGQLYRSRDWGATLVLVRTKKLIAIAAWSQSGEHAPNDFGFSDSAVHRLQGGLPPSARATWAGVSRGTANAQTLTPYPAFTALAAGTVLEFEAGLANTGATTLNVSGVGAAALVRDNDGAALQANDLLAGCRYAALYDGASWRLICTDRLYVAIGVALAGGFVFDAQYRNN